MNIQQATMHWTSKPITATVIRMMWRKKRGNYMHFFQIQINCSSSASARNANEKKEEENNRPASQPTNRTTNVNGIYSEYMLRRGAVLIRTIGNEIVLSRFTCCALATALYYFPLVFKLKTISFLFCYTLHGITDTRMLERN